MNLKLLICLGVVSLLTACRSYDVSSLIIQDDLKRQIAAGNLRLRIEDEQVPFVADLLLDEDPLIRFAALKIMENNRRREFLNPLLETTLDEDEWVAAEAFHILESYPEWTVTFLEENLAQFGDLLCLNSLSVLESLDRETTPSAVVKLFSTDSERKKNGAARTLAALIDLDDPFMTALRESDDEAMRAGFYRIVAHYGESTLIPLLFQGIGDGSSDVWGACVSGIYGFGEEALPFVDRYIGSDDYLMNLSCLQILEVIQSDRSLPLLLSYYENPNQLLAQKAAIIVKSYGESALDKLEAYLPTDNLTANRLGLWTLREINAPRSLPLYLTLLEEKDSRLENDLILCLDARGPEIFPQLHRFIKDTDERTGVLLLSFLIARQDPNVNRYLLSSFYLIARTEDEPFYRYLDEADLETDTLHDFRSLREAREWGASITRAGYEENRYFLNYIERNRLINEGDILLEKSLKLRRESLAEGDKEKERESRELYADFDRISDLVKRLEDRMKDLPEGEQQRGIKLIASYETSRQAVVDIWLGISPRYRELARLVYDDMGLDMNALLHGVSRS